MNRYNLGIINGIIKKSGDVIQPLLPDLPNHPYRQAQTHLYTEIKYRFGKPLKEIRDSRFDDVIKLIQICCEHATEIELDKYFDWLEPEPPNPTLDDFLE